MKPVNERRADPLDRVSTALFVANVPFWARVLLVAFALILYAFSEGFAGMEAGDRS